MSDILFTLLLLASRELFGYLENKSLSLTA